MQETIITISFNEIWIKQNEIFYICTQYGYIAVANIQVKTACTEYPYNRAILYANVELRPNRISYSSKRQY